MLEMARFMNDAAELSVGSGLIRDRFHVGNFTHAEIGRNAIVGFVSCQLLESDKLIERIDFDQLEEIPPETIDSALQICLNNMVWRIRFGGSSRVVEWLRGVVMMDLLSTLDWFVALHVQSYTVKTYESMWLGCRPNSES